MHLKTFFLTVEALKEKNIFRESTVQTRHKINYSTNSYLSIHKKFFSKAAMAWFVLRYGFGNCSSKYLGGYSKTHKKLEQAVASYYQKENGMLFSSGYLASIGVLQGTVNSKTIVFADRFIHASWIDGILASNCQFRRFAHNSLEKLEELLLKYHLKFERVIILTEAVFSMHGTVVEIEKYICLAKKYNAILISDHAHSHGVIPAKFPHYELHVVMGTFSKACGSIGGYACGAKEIMQTVANLGRTQIYSTSLPNYLAAYNLWAFNYCSKNTGKMLSKATKIAKNYGLEFKGSAILTKTFETNEDAFAFQAQLLKENIFVPVVRKPTVEKPIVRFCVGV